MAFSALGTKTTVLTKITSRNRRATSRTRQIIRSQITSRITRQTLRNISRVITTTRSNTITHTVNPHLSTLVHARTSSLNHTRSITSISSLQIRVITLLRSSFYSIPTSRITRIRSHSGNTSPARLKLTARTTSIT